MPDSPPGDRPAPLRCHLLIGPPASGKTTLAGVLAGLTGAVVLSTDVVRGELFGDAAVQGPWRDIEARLHQRIRDSVAAGTPVIVDATHARRPWRLAITQALTQPPGDPWPGGVHGGVPRLGDAPMLQRVFTLLRHLLQQPFDREPGTPLPEHLIAQTETIPGAYLFARNRNGSILVATLLHTWLSWPRPSPSRTCRMRSMPGSAPPPSGTAAASTTKRSSVWRLAWKRRFPPLMRSWRESGRYAKASDPTVLILMRSMPSSGKAGLDCRRHQCPGLSAVAWSQN